MSYCDNNKFDKMRLGGWSLHVNKSFPSDEIGEVLAKGPITRNEQQRIAKTVRMIDLMELTAAGRTSDSPTSVVAMLLFCISKERIFISGNHPHNVYRSIE